MFTILNCATIASMFDKIFDFISLFWDVITPAFIIDQTEHGIIKRLGIFNREAPPGLRWKWFFIESYESESTLITTLGLNSQTLTTKDNKSIVISAIIKYRIQDVKTYLLTVYEPEDVLADVTMGEIQKQVKKTDYIGLLKVERKILPKVRKAVKDYGVIIEGITFIDIGAVKSIRLIQDAQE